MKCVSMVGVLALALLACDGFGRVGYSEIEAVEYRKVEAGGRDLLVLDADGRGVTGRFRVLDHEEGALGLMKRADTRFTDAAATAELSVAGGEIRVVITCPVPDGLQVARNTSSAWAGDGAEFFIRPDESSKAYFQYSANAAGVSVARKCPMPGQAVPGWTTRAKASVKDVGNGFAVTFAIPTDEVFAAPPKAGDSFRVNFTRAGKTCSGLSTWAAVGSQFSNVDAFGTVIYGGLRAYFNRLLARAKSDARSHFEDEEARNAARRVYAPVVEAVRAHGDDATAFAGLAAMFEDLDRKFLQIRLAGLPLLAFEPANPWGGTPDPDARSRPLERIRLTVARNSSLTTVFALANMKDTPFVGQLKFFEKEVGGEFFASGGEGIARKFTIRRGFPIWNAADRPLHDPVADLTMKSVIRLAPRESAFVYLTLDTRGLAAGTHTAVLALKKAAPGYVNFTIPVEVTVKDIDLESVRADKFGYDYVGRTFMRGRKGAPRVLKQIADLGYTHLFTGWPDYFPRQGVDGRFRKPDMTSLKLQVDAAVASGIPRERLKVWIYMGADIVWNCPRYANGDRIPVAKPEWEEGIRQMVKWADEYLRGTCGISRDRIIWYTVDEPGGDINDPEFKSTISIAHRTGLVIKGLGADFLTMTDPTPDFLKSNTIGPILPELVRSHDIIELYRAGITPQTAKLVRDAGFKEVWTYSIITKETPAAKYRRDYWENMRDGYREIATFWHMTDCAGGDALDSADCHRKGHYDDYATIYVDYDNDAAMLSRRQLAHDNGFEEARLILCCRARAKGDAAKLKRIDEIVRTAADDGSMAAMDAARNKLLGL